MIFNLRVCMDGKVSVGEVAGGSGPGSRIALDTRPRADHTKLADASACQPARGGVIKRPRFFSLFFLRESGHRLFENVR